MQKYTDVVTSARSGAAIPSARVTVKTHPAAVTATIYSDDGITTKTNPLTTDENGEFSFYAADGDYTLTVSGTGITERTIGPITLLDGDDDDADTFDSTDVNFTQSGSGAISRTVQNKARDQLHLFDFLSATDQGYITDRDMASQTPATNDTAIARLITEAQTHKRAAHLPPGLIVYSDEFEMTSPIALIGHGARLTTFRPIDAYVGGWFLTINNCGRVPADVQPNPDSTVDGSGVILQGWSVQGNRTTNASGTHGVRTYQSVYAMLARDVHIEYLKGTAWSLGEHGVSNNGVCRESEFYRIKSRLCGENGVHPHFVISTGSAAGDGSNQLDFYSAHLNYNYSEMLITNASATEITRRLRFFSPMMHGLGSSATPSANDLAIIRGRVRDAEFNGVKLNGTSEVTGTKYAGFRLEDDAGATNRPWYIKIHAHITTASGDGVVVDQGDYLDINLRGADSDVAGDSLRFGASSLSDYGTNVAASGTISNGFAINSGVKQYINGLQPQITTTASYDPPSLLGDIGDTLNVATKQAFALGDLVLASARSAGNFLMYFGSVQAADTLDIRIHNPTGGAVNQAAAPFYARRIDETEFKAFATATYDAAEAANNATTTTTVTIPGAALGDFVAASLAIDLEDLILSAHVSAADTVTAVLTNCTGDAVDLDSETLKAALIKEEAFDVRQSVTWDPASTVDAATTQVDVTVPGIALGDFVMVSFSLDLQGMTLYGKVSAADTVRVIIYNQTGGTINLDEGTLKIGVMKRK